MQVKHLSPYFHLPPPPLPCLRFGAFQPAPKIQRLEGGDGSFVPKSWHLKQPKSSSVNASLIFQVAQNSEHILIYICIELVLGIIISICRWTPTGGVDERTFVAAEREGGKLFCFLGVSWRFSAKLNCWVLLGGLELI